jgi:hypothetical protein
MHAVPFGVERLEFVMVFYLASHSSSASKHSQQPCSSLNCGIGRRLLSLRLQVVACTAGLACHLASFVGDRTP